MVRRILVASALMLIALPVWAQPTGNEAVAQCISNDAAAKISGCTAVIESGQAAGEDLAIAYSNRGIAYDFNHLHDLAIADFSRAITLWPGYIYAYYNRGTAYGSKASYDLAIADFTKAITLKPDFADAYIARGGAYFLTHRNREAIADYRAALKIDPTNQKTLVAINSITALTHVPDPCKAFTGADSTINECTKLIDAGVGPPERLAAAYYDRGVALREKHFPSIADFTKAIELKPDYAEAYEERGWAREELFSYDQAIADFSQAITLRPDLDDAYTGRGVAESNKGLVEQSMADYRAALKLNPAAGVAQSGLDLLNLLPDGLHLAGTSWTRIDIACLIKDIKFNTGIRDNVIDVDLDSTFRVNKIMSDRDAATWKLNRNQLEFQFGTWVAALHGSVERADKINFTFDFKTTDGISHSENCAFRKHS
jgi:tetratricopeptide (TPR) repeat protein